MKYIISNITDIKPGFEQSLTIENIEFSKDCSPTLKQTICSILYEYKKRAKPVTTNKDSDNIVKIPFKSFIRSMQDEKKL